MSEDAIKTGFMGPLSDVFGPRRNGPGLVTQLARKLTAPLTVEQCERAAETALRSGAKTWPSFDTCLRLLQDAAVLPEARASTGGIHEQRQAREEALREEWSPEAMAKADALIVSSTGATAAREGWIVGLWDFCRKNRRLPDDREVSRVRSKSLESRETVIKAGKALPPVLAAYLDRVQRLTALADGLRITDERDERAA